MENQVQTENKDIHITKEDFLTSEEVKKQVLKSLNNWDLFTMENK